MSRLPRQGGFCLLFAGCCRVQLACLFFFFSTLPVSRTNSTPQTNSLKTTTQEAAVSPLDDSGVLFILFCLKQTKPSQRLTSANPKSCPANCCSLSHRRLVQAAVGSRPRFNENKAELSESSYLVNESNTSS